ncbi:hypothetical protein FJ250_06765 [bacterium]|nr:hypothetical protein [bacterium]
MRPLVALVEARPETVAEDYRRALALAGLDRAPAAGPRAVVAALDGAAWRPGRTCPPWQVAAALAATAATGPVTVAASGPAGPRPWPTGAAWERAAGGHALADATAGAAPVPWRPREQLASLEAAGGAPTIPAALRRRALLVLAAADLVSPWRLEGACATAGRLVLGGHPARRGVPAPEVRAETVAALREAFGGLAAVVDGTVWHVGPRGRALARHVIIAGDDALAVDAVALRLAGRLPRDVPWLRACAERGLGAVEPGDMRLAGQVELLSLDFDLPEPDVARPRPGGALTRLWRLPARGKDGAGDGGPWAALHADWAAPRAEPAAAGP